MDLTALFSIANIGLGIAALTAAVISLAFTVREWRAASKATNELKFAEAIQSDDISKLGNYLEHVIGGLTVGEYVKDRDVKRRVDASLDRVLDFLNRDTLGVEFLFPVQSEAAPARSSIGKKNEGELLRLNDDIDRGEVWNALAKLRRYLEQCLSKFAQARGVDVGVRKGAGFLIQRLQRADMIDHRTAEELLTAVGLANRAIHGEDVTADEARTAVLTGLSAISRIGVETD
jgi:hypothetical protein